MLHLLKSKIEALTEGDGLPLLNKHIGAGAFIISQDSHSLRPMHPEYVKAIQAFHNIQATDFSGIKSEAIGILDALIDWKEVTIPGRSFDLFAAPKERKEFDYGLLLIEQDYIDFFKERESQSPFEPHERLKTHLFMQWEGDKVGMRIMKEDLPEKLKEDIMNLFSSIYPPIP